MILSYRITLNLLEESGLEPVERSGYRVILMDTCFLVKWMSRLPDLSSIEAVKSSKRIPAICDFIEEELRHLARPIRSPAERGAASPPLRWAEFREAVASSKILIGLDTGAKSLRSLSQLIRSVDKPIRRVIFKQFSGLSARSNQVDIALISTAAILARRGVGAGIASIDQRLLDAVEVLAGEGLDLTPVRRPWQGD